MYLKHENKRTIINRYVVIRSCISQTQRKAIVTKQEKGKIRSDKDKMYFIDPKLGKPNQPNVL